MHNLVRFQFVQFKLRFDYDNTFYIKLSFLKNEDLTDLLHCFDTGFQTTKMYSILTITLYTAVHELIYLEN